jgi:MFS family permease
MRLWPKDFQIHPRQLIAVTALFSSSFGWFYLLHLFLLEALFKPFNITEPETVMIRMIFYVSITLSALLGSTLSEKIARRHLLRIWVLSGTILTAIPLLFQEYTGYILLDIALGTSFGIGFPSCMAQIVEWTSIEERSRVYGLVILTMFAYSSGLAIVLTSANLSALELIEVGIILRAISVIPLLLQRYDQAERKRNTWRSSLSTRGLSLYLLPWLMFLLATGVLSLIELHIRVVYAFDPYVVLGLGLQYLSLSIFAFISGAIGDYYGRKRALMPGLALLGLSYLFFSVITSPMTYLIMKLITGIAWGFIVTNVLTVLGDLAATAQSEKMFAIGGVAPLIFSLAPQGLAIALEVNIDASLIIAPLGGLLFVSMIPLFYAVETLPEDKRHARLFRDYLKKVGDMLDQERADEQS